MNESCIKNDQKDYMNDVKFARKTNEMSQTHNDNDQIEDSNTGHIAYSNILDKSRLEISEEKHSHSLDVFEIILQPLYQLSAKTK